MVFWNKLRRVKASKVSSIKKIDLVSNLSAYGLNCTSCEACSNVCSFGAISMLPDNLGFLIPEIDHSKCTKCKKCLSVCPPINAVNNTNDASPLVYAVAASDFERERSSSGAVFALLAERTLREDGVVVGAKLSDDCRSAKLEIVSSLDDLHHLRGSKYIQSYAGDVYRQVKKILNEGRPVLFSGLPCQVAAMKMVLGREASNLLTIDLLCHSAPSPTLYSKFLSERPQNKKLENVSFRPRELPWGDYGMRFDYADGSSELTTLSNNSFLKGFFSSLYSKDSCNNCQFQSVPRQGDLTIGDCWGVKELYPDWDTAKGISAVMINTTKGANAFDTLFECSDIRPINLDFLRTHNRLSGKRKPHLSKARFMDELLPSMSFSKAVDMALGWKFDLAISGGWCVPNYGGAITYFALYTVCRNLGFHPIMVETCKRPPEATPHPRVFRETPYPFYNVSRVHKSLDEMKELNRRVPTFLVGSDQVWNHSISGWGMDAAGPSYCFAYVAPWRKRISYATSFGSVRYLGSRQDKIQFSRELQKFDYISVREDAGVKICANEFNLRAEKKADPVFLCPPENYLSLARKSKFDVDDTSMVAYFVWPDSLRATPDILDRLSSQLLCKKYVAIGDAAHANERSKKSQFPFEQDFKAEDWLKCFADCRFVVTDSFHAVCFSIIFRKRFVFVQSDHASMDHGLDRLVSLLESVGLINRMVKGLENVLNNPILHEDIDYDSVYAKLKPQVEDGLSWLKRVIEAPKDFNHGK